MPPGSALNTLNERVMIAGFPLIKYFLSNAFPNHNYREHANNLRNNLYGLGKRRLKDEDDQEAELFANGPGIIDSSF